ncbi:MAG: hypothetical protein H6Q64_2250, partial [Firmicutes bacterium]|nr:hypothetical protein [Bacillota bacterium]
NRRELLPHVRELLLEAFQLSDTGTDNPPLIYRTVE